MTDLDRLLELKDELNNETGYFDHEKYYAPLEKEFDSLKKEIQGLIEKGKKYEDLQLPFSHRVYIPNLKNKNKALQLENESLKKRLGESILNSHDDVFELGERKYWDIKKFGSFFKVETRMEYDKEHCERIINLIIHAFQMNLDSELEQQNKALTEQVKELQEEQEAFLQFNGCESFIQLQGKIHQQFSDEAKLKEQVKQLQEVIDFIKSEKYTVSRPSKVRIMLESLLCRDFSNVRSQLAELDNIQSERDQLKSKIEKIIKDPYWKVHTGNLTHDSYVTYSQTELQMMIGQKFKELAKEILGEKS
ncbi:hypothetical protein [Nitrososphaeria virus YSH_462411]|uniref:Uncharacterized protein n=1 Tax=Nitrososphaeria virus YSH_462411 TaxID=3071321 RepID=A0A976YF48_9CAUD|nr:hypothetical protein QKV92_gp35 [Yangshan Harbor Nitrososphaeria virus]UVF62307.1 hypothetical protein [Nitrososphaeria virus YSH_462411]